MIAAEMVGKQRSKRASSVPFSNHRREFTTTVEVNMVLLDSRFHLLVVVDILHLLLPSPSAHCDSVRHIG